VDEEEEEEEEGLKWKILSNSARKCCQELELLGCPL
jgi:hypothetical protein